MEQQNQYQAKANELAGRPIEVEKTKDGKYIAIFMVFNESPPPKGDTEEEALKGFIEWYQKRPGWDLPEGSVDLKELQSDDD
jgi:hypothetical protein